MRIAGHFTGEHAFISNIDGELVGSSLPERIATETRRALTQNDTFEAIIQSANVGIIVSDPTLPDNPTVFVNPAFLRITGYSREEVLGRNCRFLQDGGTDPEVLVKLRAAMHEGRSFRGLVRNRRKDGTFFWNELVVDPVFDKNGALVNFVGIQNDVTERVEAQRALRESQERLQAILNNTTSLIFVKDVSGRFVLVNRQFQRQLCSKGVTPTGRTDIDIFGGETAAIFRAHDREVLSEGRALEFEEKVTQADGPHTYISVRFPLRNQNGVINGIGGISMDITSRKEMEADLRSSKARKAAVLEAALDAVIITDESGGIYEANPAARAMFGYTATELLGKNLADLIRRPGVRGNEDRTNLFAQINEPTELPAVRKDGTEFPVELAITRIAVDGPAMFTGHIRDITRRRQIEATLRLAKEEAERANAAKNEFLSRMSHELRTPLNAILGFSQLLARRKLEERAAENVRHISQAGSHLLDLVTEVLDFSRIEVGETSLSVETVVLGEILQASIDLVWNQAQTRGITFHYDAPALADIYAVADRQRLKQIFVNLLSNAVKYNRSKGSVTIECERADSSPLHISFRDTGEGISADDLKRLFTPFERLMPDKSAIEGTGIGLAISQRLAKMMQGSIEVESIVGEGTTFTVIIPAGTQPKELKDAPSISVDESPAPVGEQTVLYIEDNPANLRLMEQIAEEHGGIKLVKASSGGGAVELAREVRPKLILLDLHLPDVFGDKILTLLRADPEFSKTPIYMVSADAMNSQIKRLLKSGANGYLTKPINVAQVMEVFDKHLAPLS